MYISEFKKISNSYATLRSIFVFEVKVLQRLIENISDRLQNAVFLSGMLWYVCSLSLIHWFPEITPVG